MTSIEQLITTFINCGRYKYQVTTFNDRSNIDQIHETVRLLCGSHIPNVFCLEFYNFELKKFVKLNQNHLSQEFNLFRLNSSIDGHDVVPFVELYVIDTTDEYEILSHETSAVGSNSTIKETVSEQDLPIIDMETDVNNYQGQHLFNALLDKGQNDIDILMQSAVTNNNEESLPEYGDEPQSYFNLSSNHTQSDNSNPDLSDALLTDGQSVQNLLVNNDSSERITTGIAIPPRNNSLIPIRYQPSIELNEMPNRLYFSLDVKPEQKKVYKSDQFNQKIATETNGYIARVQGIKTPSQKMSSVWPKVRIPILFRNKRNVRLVVYAVSERLQYGMRIWSKHRDKGFLPKGFTHESSPVNPIEFDVKQNSLTIEGDLILELPMTTLWNKLQQTEIIYQLDEQSTIDLHTAEHDSLSPRLLCILRDGNHWYADTICLSDFIRSKSRSKRNLPVTNNTVQTNKTVRKRSRAK